jgi:hypothetical protein
MIDDSYHPEPPIGPAFGDFLHPPAELVLDFDTEVEQGWLPDFERFDKYAALADETLQQAKSAIPPDLAQYRMSLVEIGSVYATLAVACLAAPDA